MKEGFSLWEILEPIWMMMGKQEGKVEEVKKWVMTNKTSTQEAGRDGSRREQVIGLRWQQGQSLPKPGEEQRAEEME